MSPLVSDSLTSGPLACNVTPIGISGAWTSDAWTFWSNSKANSSNYNLNIIMGCSTYSIYIKGVELLISCINSDKIAITWLKVPKQLYKFCKGLQICGWKSLNRGLHRESLNCSKLGRITNPWVQVPKQWSVYVTIIAELTHLSAWLCVPLIYECALVPYYI